MTVRKFFGWIFVILGGMISVLTSGCTLIFWATQEGFRISDWFTWIIALGIAPFLVGLILFFIGKWMVWPQRKSKAPPHP